jgi:hypothetical protein
MLIKLIKKGLVIKFNSQIMEIAMALVLRALIVGLSDKESIYEKVFEELEEMGYELADIEDTLEEVFQLEAFNDNLMFPFQGLSHVVFDIYLPNRRIPIELLSGVDDEYVREMFGELYAGKISPEKFEISLEIGEDIDFQIDVFN